MKTTWTEIERRLKIVWYDVNEEEKEEEQEQEEEEEEEKRKMI